MDDQNQDECAKLNGNVAAAPNFATVGHIFGALPGAQIIHTISLFEAWEVRSLKLQTVLDLELKRRRYGRLTTITQNTNGNFAAHFLKLGAFSRPISQLQNGRTTLRSGTRVPKGGFAVAKHPSNWGRGCEIKKILALALRSLSSNGHNFFISNLNCTSFEALDS